MSGIVIGLIIAGIFIFAEIFDLKEEFKECCLTGFIRIAAIIFVTSIAAMIHPIIGLIAFIITCRTICDN